MGEDRSGKFHNFFFIYSPFLFYLSNKFLQLYRSSHYRDHELSIIRIVNRKRIGSADRLCRAVVLLVNTHLFGRPHIVGVQSRQREPSRFMCPKLAHSRPLPSAWIADLAGHARLIVPPFVQGEIEGAHPHCKKELAVYFFVCSLTPFLTEISRCHHCQSQRQPQPYPQPAQTTHIRTARSTCLSIFACGTDSSLLRTIHRRSTKLSAAAGLFSRMCYGLARPPTLHSACFAEQTHT